MFLSSGGKFGWFGGFIDGEGIILGYLLESLKFSFMWFFEGFEVGGLIRLREVSFVRCCL